MSHLNVEAFVGNEGHIMSAILSIRDAILDDLRCTQANRNAPEIDGLLDFWRRKIGTTDALLSHHLHTAQFQTEISKIKFRGLSAVPVLILGEDPEQVRAAISPYVSTTPARSLGIVICLTEAAHKFVLTRSSLPPARFLVISPTDFDKFVSHESPIDFLRELFRIQIPYHRLIPFSIAEPTEGSLFVGREHELNQLMYENQDFALCGTGGVGKTSLLRQLKWQLRRQRDPRWQRIVEVDLLANKADLDVAARTIAMRIAPTKRSDEVTCSTLKAHLHRLWLADPRFDEDGPIDLFIDEIDEILALDRRTKEGDHYYPLMRQLRAARLQKSIRITLSGREETAKLLNDPHSPFALPEKRDTSCRFKVLELGRLTDKEATELLVRPLKDLGYPVEQQYSTLMKHLKDCEGIPVQVQSLGLDLANGKLLPGSQGLVLGSGI